MPPDAVSQHDQDALLRRLRDMEARSRSLERQLEASDRLAAVGALAAGLAHEFNNLLTPMAGVARLALDEPPDASLTRRALESALAAADRGSRLADSILTLAGDALRAPPRRTDAVANVAEAVQGALACVVRDPARDGVSLRIDAPPTLAAAIPQPALRQILLNLILNALHAMRSAPGGELAITAQRSTWNNGGHANITLINNDDMDPSSPPEAPSHKQRRPPGPPLPGTETQSENDAPSPQPRARACIRITVLDTGPGVPADLLPRIFEPFVTTRTQPPPAAQPPISNAQPPSPSERAAGDESHSDPGRVPGSPEADDHTAPSSCAGLGLAICRRLVRAAGGDIAAENAHPTGARFTITLPEAQCSLSPREKGLG